VLESFGKASRKERWFAKMIFHSANSKTTTKGEKK